MPDPLQMMSLGCERGLAKRHAWNAVGLLSSPGAGDPPPLAIAVYPAHGSIMIESMFESLPWHGRIALGLGYTVLAIWAAAVVLRVVAFFGPKIENVQPPGWGEE